MRGTVSRIQCCSGRGPFSLKKGSDPMRFRCLAAIHPRMAWIYRVDQGRHLPTAHGICQRRGGVGRQDRWRHGWRHRAPRGEGALLAKQCFASARTPSRQRLGRAAERVHGVSCLPTPPRHPTECRFCCCCVLLPASGRHCQRVPGAAGRPPSTLFAVVGGHVLPAHLAGVPGHALGQKHRAVLAAGAAERHGHVAAGAIPSFGSQVSRKSISWAR